MKQTMDHAITGHVGLICGWILGFIGATSLGIVPIVLSSIASLLAIINYYYQIKKNKKDAGKTQ
jgi:hypothetical protein